jgi:hypothetical protein
MSEIVDLYDRKDKYGQPVSPAAQEAIHRFYSHPRPPPSGPNSDDIPAPPASHAAQHELPCPV